MTASISSAERLADTGFTEMRVVDGVIHGDPYTYIDGVTAKDLRSGVDGPHAGLADRVCNINGRLYE